MLIPPRAGGTPRPPCILAAPSFTTTALSGQAPYCAVGQPRDFLSKSLTLTPYLLPSPFPVEYLRSSGLQLSHLGNKTVLSAYWCGGILLYAWGV